jgi:non-heme chloroperoxidase
MSYCSIGSRAKANASSRQASSWNPARAMALATLFLGACLSAPMQGWGEDEFASRHFTTSDGVELHYLEAGSGSTIIFVPGYTMPAEIWEPQLRHFASAHRVVALDPRSQGRSQKASEGHYLSRRGRDIGELISHLDAAPAVVVAWSLGVLELLTLTHETGSEDIRAAVLVDMYLGVDEEIGEPHPFEPFWRDWLIGLQQDRINWTRDWVQGMYGTEQPNEYLDAITQAVLKTPTNTAVTLLANLMLVEPRDLRPAFDELKVPLLYVVVSAAWAQEAQHRRPDIQVKVFENAEHALFVDEAERFNALLHDFLAALP